MRSKASVKYAGLRSEFEWQRRRVCSPLVRDWNPNLRRQSPTPMLSLVGRRPAAVRLLALALVIGVAIEVGDVVFVVLEAITLEDITWIQR